MEISWQMATDDDKFSLDHPILFRATQYGTHFKEPIPTGNTRRGNPNITLLHYQVTFDKNFTAKSRLKLLVP